MEKSAFAIRLVTNLIDTNDLTRIVVDMLSAQPRAENSPTLDSDLQKLLLAQKSLLKVMLESALPDNDDEEEEEEDFIDQEPQRN